MQLSEMFPTDAGKVEKGVEVNIGEVTFTLSYFNSTKSDFFFKTKTKIYNRDFPLADATMKALHETLSELIVMGWSNLFETDDSGARVEVKYSTSECIRILSTYPGLDMALMEESLKIDLFRREERNTTKGKSKKP